MRSTETGPQSRSCLHLIFVVQSNKYYRRLLFLYDQFYVKFICLKMFVKACPTQGWAPTHGVCPAGPGRTCWEPGPAGSRVLLGAGSCWEPDPAGSRVLLGAGSWLRLCLVVHQSYTQQLLPMKAFKLNFVLAVIN